MTDDRLSRGLERQMTMRRRMLDSGAAHVGWKVGFGAPAALERLAITAPLVGFMTGATVLGSGDTAPVASWTKGIVEFEVAAYMGTDLGPGATPEEGRAAVAAVGPAIELADVDIDPLDDQAVEGILAGDIFHRGVIFGEPDRGRSGFDTEGLEAEILVDGAVHTTTTDLMAITGDYGWICTVVADTLAGLGERLRAGDVIITGSVIPPVPVTEGSVFAFALHPFPPISVRIDTTA